MRGAASVILVLFAAIVIVLLYFFLGKAQMNRMADELEGDLEALHAQLAEIHRREAEIPSLTRQLPVWRQQLIVLNQAIPPTIEDDSFFASLAAELAEQEVELLAVDVVLGGAWLKDVTEEELQELESKGIRVDTARQIRVAFYNIKLSGEFGRVLTVFENLKKYRRLYTIDQVIAPASGGVGTITQTVDPSMTPIEVTGTIFYGVPEGYLPLEDLEARFMRAAVVPVARSAQGSISAAAQLLVDGSSDEGGREQTGTAQHDAAASAAGEDEEASREVDGVRV